MMLLILVAIVFSVPVTLFAVMMYVTRHDRRMARRALARLAGEKP